MRIIGLIIICSIALASCNKEESPYDEKGRGSGYALLNGNAWDVTTYAQDYDPNRNIVHVNLNVKDSYGIVRESLSFTNVKLKTGKTEINHHTYQNSLDHLLIVSYHTFAADGDVTADRFFSSQPTGNEILSIESYDETTGEIQGTFTAVVVGTPTYDLSLPDTLRFEEGWFKVKIVE